MTIEFRLEPALSLAAHLGNPQNSIPSYVHIAGILGKTSTALFLTRFVRAGTSLCVGTFIHPPIWEWRECILIDGKPLETAAFEELCRHVNKMDEIFNTRCSHYEKLVCVAMLAFREWRVEIAIVESALGGTFDATNVLGHGNHASKQMAAVLTNIVEDHTNYLGCDLDAITKGIAGIIRPGAAVLLAMEQAPEILCTLDNLKIELARKIEIFGHIDAASFFITKMPPHQQYRNIDLALRTYQTIAPRLESTFNRKCRKPVHGELTDLQFPHSFVELYHRNHRIIVDSAQNGGSLLCKWLRNASTAPNRRLHLVLGLGEKTEQVWRTFFKSLGCNPNYRFSFARFRPPPGYPWIHPGDRHAFKELLKDVWSLAGSPEPNITDMSELEEIMSENNISDEYIVIFGSPHIVKDFYAFYSIM
jgi:folylpolyglutamate synthase/dihydrofolate synthase